MNVTMNKVLLIGHIGNEPELRQVGTTALLRLRLATHTRYRDKHDQQQERTDWHTAVIWGKRAEHLSQMLGQGDLVVVEGELRTDSYEKDGIKRWATEVRVMQLRLVGQRQAQPRQAAQDQAAQDQGVQDQPFQAALPTAVARPAGPPPLPRRRNGRPQMLAA